MVDHDESFLVSSVVFGADMWTTIGHLSYIHNYIRLHITHIIIITICDRLWENRPLRAQIENRVIGIQG